MHLWEKKLSLSYKINILLFYNLKKIISLFNSQKISIFIIIGSSNAVNLTDGLDGLAILPVIIITAALGIIAWASGNVIAADYLYIPNKLILRIK